ncbi:hypothetical protein Salat_2961500 [Sesamum alatum]|uniref:Uncharacterized protein n=1 Tax=Sesamum alatum TaxID=300844 RepID=A0AAE1XIS8_9LAMI|nr:hypothetical protein Salat_2961500 [Sesamum alatum]
MEPFPSRPSSSHLNIANYPPRSAPTAAPPGSRPGFAATAAPSYSSGPGSCPDGPARSCSLNAGFRSLRTSIPRTGPLLSGVAPPMPLNRAREYQKFPLNRKPALGSASLRARVGSGRPGCARASAGAGQPARASAGLGQAARAPVGSRGVSCAPRWQAGLCPQPSPAAVPFFSASSKNIDFKGAGRARAAPPWPLGLGHPPRAWRGLCWPQSGEIPASFSGGAIACGGVRYWSGRCLMASCAADANHVLTIKPSGGEL